MYNAVFQHFDNADIAIMSAAVADYAPKEIAQEKIKKNDEEMTITLVKNPDILKTMGEKKEKPIFGWFRLRNSERRRKRKRKTGAKKPRYDSPKFAKKTVAQD